MSSTAHYDFIKLCASAHKSVSKALAFDQGNSYLNGQRDLKSAIALYQHGVACINSVLEYEQILPTETTKFESLRNTLDRIQERLAVLTKSESEQNATKRKPASAAAPRKKYSKEQQELAHQILDEILIEKPMIQWKDVVGLDQAKTALYEIVILPYLRPELFTGLRTPARGVLLFGPPGTGKTMLAKAVASESKARFFSISASSLTSKNYGEAEKLVRALFSMAREYKYLIRLQPSIIFIDEIDSILTKRSEGDHEASRRLKTEFLLQFDGIASAAVERILLLAATNRPMELDEAALRRMAKRIYIPLPEQQTRKLLLKHVLEGSVNNLSNSDLNRLSIGTKGYSSSDITALAKDAALGPIRRLGPAVISTPKDQIPPITAADFDNSMRIIRPSVSNDYVAEIERWNSEMGVSGI